MGLRLEADKENIKKALRGLKEATGEMPVGCYFGRATPNTKALFPEAWREVGAEMLYCSEAYNDDVPYWLDLPAEKDLPDAEKKGMLIVPYNYDVNGGLTTLIAPDKGCHEKQTDSCRREVPHEPRIRRVGYV